MSTKKIAYVTTGLSTGGAEMMLYKLLRATPTKEFEPVVVSLTNKGVLGERIEALGVTVYAINMKPGRPTLAGLWRMSTLLRRLRPDIVQAWMYHANLAASLIRVITGRRFPVLWGIRDSLDDYKAEKRATAAVIRLGAFVSNQPSKIIYNSLHSAGQHVAIGYSEERTVVIPNGFDCDEFRPSLTARKDLRRSLKLDESAILIGLIGRYHRKKDHATFLIAAGRIAHEHPDLRFVLVGSGIDAKNVQIGKLISANGLQERVYLLGERHDIPMITAGLDIACCSSTNEAFPNVVGEAMACAVPCVVTDVGDSAWIVGKTGKVVPPQNPEALALGLEEMVNAGVDGRLHLGQEARDRVLQNFSLQHVTSRYEELYRKVLSNGER